jgi:hypothetical protein
MHMLVYIQFMIYYIYDVVLIHKTSLIPPRFMELSVPSQEGLSCRLYVLGLSIFASIFTIFCLDLGLFLPCDVSVYLLIR